MQPILFGSAQEIFVHRFQEKGESINPACKPQAGRLISSYKNCSPGFSHLVRHETYIYAPTYFSDETKP